LPTCPSPRGGFHGPRFAGRGCKARSNIALTTGAFAENARLDEQAAATARTGGDLADASLQLGVAAVAHLLVADAPRAVPLAREALVLARQIGAPALIASSLLAVGATVAQTDPDRARACLRESLELSTTLGYRGPLDHAGGAAIAFLLNDRTATLELGRSTVRALQRGGDRCLMVFMLHVIAGTLAATSLRLPRSFRARPKPMWPSRRLPLRSA